MIKNWSKTLCLLILCSCGVDQESLINFEEFAIHTNGANEQDFKTLFFDDELISVFRNEVNQNLSYYSIHDTALILTESMKVKDSLNLNSRIYPVDKNEMILYAPWDSLELTYLGKDTVMHINFKNDSGLWNNGLVISQDPKLCNYYSGNVNSFEFKLETFNKNISENSYPMTGSLDLNTRDIDFIGVKFPKLYQDNYYGLLSDIQQVYTDEYIFYNPIILPEIWRYNRLSEVVDIIPFQSQYQTFPVPSISSEDLEQSDSKTILMKHQKQNGKYPSFVYNKYTNHYYRFYVHPMPEKNEEGYFNTYKDAKVSVIILDENLEVIEEKMLPEACFFIYLTVPTKDGLIINRGSLFEEEKMNLLLISVDETKVDTK